MEHIPIDAALLCGDSSMLRIFCSEEIRTNYNIFDSMGRRLFMIFCHGDQARENQIQEQALYRILYFLRLHARDHCLHGTLDVWPGSNHPGLVVTDPKRHNPGFPDV
jgi:hypothetical protein